MTRKRRFHYKDKQHRDPAVKSIKKWTPANRGFYDRFRRWLREGGYSDSATLRAAIQAASQTAVVVGGAGNDSKSDPFYPAAYDD